MKIDDSLGVLLRDTHELESFFHDFIEHLTKRRPKAGEDVTHLAEEKGLKIPEVLNGLPMTWAGGEPDIPTEKPQQTLVFVRPGNLQAVGLTIGCINVGKHTKVCLECGWIYCRIVIRGRF
jgi:hypothetical protein